MAGGAEHLSLADDVRGDRVEDGVRHLTGDKARPDQTVQLELVGRKVLADLLGEQLHVGRADGFVRVLRARLGLVNARLAGIVVLAVAALMKPAAAAVASSASRSESVRI